MTAPRVLCVDLDGTLVATDLLWESVMSATRNRPRCLLALPIWFLRGRPVLKRKLAEAAAIDFATLPYRPEILSIVAEARQIGRPVVLATASDRLLAEGVSQHLAVFSEVLASDGVINFKGSAKAASLVERYGSGNFDYIGDSRADIPCWLSAHDAMSVGATPMRRVPHLRRLSRGMAGNNVISKLSSVLRALRPHQWLKNLLVLVPVLGAHQFDRSTAMAVALAFLSLSLTASGGYVLNDLLDLSADRRHSRKRHRPFASGQLSIATGVGLIALLWAVGFGIALAWLPGAFAALLLVYLTGTAAYSLRLKRAPVLDVLFLAGLYVIRVIGGGLATGVPVSTWLLAFTLFICLSLAFLKRFIEVRSQPTTDGSAAVPGRGYVADDAVWLQSAGLASAYLSVVILALYVNNPDVTRLYAHPDRLLLICPLLLYGATSIWLKAQRRQIHDDPLVAVASDPASYAIVALTAAIVFVSI